MEKNARIIVPSPVAPFPTRQPSQLGHMPPNLSVQNLLYRQQILLRQQTLLISPLHNLLRALGGLFLLTRPTQHHEHLLQTLVYPPLEALRKLITAHQNPILGSEKQSPKQTLQPHDVRPRHEPFPLILLLVFSARVFFVGLFLNCYGVVAHLAVCGELVGSLGGLAVLYENAEDFHGVVYCGGMVAFGVFGAGEGVVDDCGAEA